tara:strand:- start:14065 stop:15861 length:1797 start_codon:yes stop_codon:yes gene_type:complete
MSSLVICGNEINNDTGGSQFQSAFSFNNHLKQPLRIPPNSEVAVQSLKIVKEGSLTISPDTKWYQFFGEKLSSTTSQAETTSAPIPATFGITDNKSVRASELATELQSAVNKGVANPETFGFNEVSQIEDTAGEFDGFRYNFKTRSNASSLNVLPTKWVNSYDEADGYMVYNSASNTLTGGKNNSPYNVAIGTDNPIALNNGEYIVDLSNASGTNWSVGLTRSRASGKNPDYSNATDSDIYKTSNIFCDFLVGSFQRPDNQTRFIRVYQAVYDSTSDKFDDEKPIAMKEVDYTSGSGAFNSLYNWSTNTSAGDNYTKVKISVVNEKVKVELYNANDGYLVLVSPDSPSKLNKYKPVADSCRALYPLAYIQSNASTKYLTIDKFGGRDIGMTYGLSDWWGYLSRNDLEVKYGQEVDTRIYNDKGNTAETHTYKGLNASGFLDYDFVMIVDRDPNDRYKDTQDARASSILGFNTKSVLDTYDATNSLGGGYYDSTSTPTLKSTSSIFVRLNNFNITTYNANVSAFSNIIYSAPRFSTGTDKNVGSLFFESPEKSYVSLNNESELVANSFSIDLVNENETLATDLTGKSVCILHFRKSPKM